jgi:hypothetical protein
MRWDIMAAAALAAATGACASYSEKIPATYVSPILYENLSCRQIAEEAARISRRAAEVAGVQDSQATKDSVVTGVDTLFPIAWRRSAVAPWGLI